MSIETQGNLRGRVPAVKILEFIKRNFDENATMHISERKYPSENYGNLIKVHYGDDFSHITEFSGFINFHQEDGTKRNLYYFYRDVNTYENYDYYVKNNLQEMVVSETTRISLGCFGDSVKIIKAIVEHFGGWIDENNCDDEEYYPIFKEKYEEDDFIIMTHAQLDEHFGKRVVVVDKII